MRIAIRAFAALAGLALSGPPLAAEVPVASTVVPVVRAFEIRGEEGLRPPADLASLVSVEVGQPLDRERLRQSVRSLRAALEATEVEAHLRPVAGGVEVVFALWTGVRVRAIDLTGTPCFERPKLFAEIDQLTAAPLSESRLLRSLYQLQDLHREAGYLEARVRLGVDVGPAGGAVVSFAFECGVVARVGGVAFQGDRGPFESAQLVALLDFGPGERYYEAGVRRDGRALEEWLIGEGFRLARVAEPEVSYDPEAAEVHALFEIEVGPKFEVRVSGVDPKELQRSGLMPLSGQERFDEALRLRDLDRLRRHYQEKGHYRVSIDSRVEEPEGVRRHWVLIERGPIYQLRGITWDPMTAISESQLDTLVETAPRRRLRGGGRLVDKTLEEDIAAVRSSLALRGFDRARVGPPVIEEDGLELRVHVPVVEGPRRRVVQLDFLGLEALDEVEARSLLRLREGGAFHPLLLDDSLDALRARYEELGFSRVQAAATVSWNDDQTLADIELRVLEGPRTVVERVILRGNRATEPAPILRAVRLDPGDTVGRGDLLEVQRRLYALGIFSSVEVDLAPGAPLTGLRDVIIRVREGRSRRVSYGVGWDSEDGFRALLGLSHANLLRRAINGRLDLRWSEREQQARLIFSQPPGGRLDFQNSYSLFVTEEVLESFTSKRQGFQFASTRLLERSTLNLLYTYKLIDVVPDSAFSALGPGELTRVLDIERDLQEVALSSVRPAWLVDHRDDPVLPSRGWSSTLSVEYAFPFLGTDAEFVKSFSQQTAYADLGRLGTAGASLRIGAIEPIGGLTTPGALASSRVPISERFFAGGRTTHRAYRRDRLGIRGDTLVESDEGLISVGGDGLLLMNLDWRIPIAGPVGGVLFADAGNVWSDWRNIDAGEVKAGAGLGVRYQSPIGPLRLEVGWKLDRERDESPAVIFLSFGNPF